jgi:hypothetical protein
MLGGVGGVRSNAAPIPIDGYLAVRALTITTRCRPHILNDQGDILCSIFTAGKRIAIFALPLSLAF